MNTRKIAALVLGVALVLGAMLFSNCPPRVLLDPAALLLVLGVMLLGSLWSHAPGDIAALGIAYLRPGALEEEVGQRAHALFVHMSRLAFGAGYVGVLVGAVNLLRALDDPTKIGPAVALALLSMLYALVLGSLVLGSMAQDCLVRIERRGPDPQRTD